MANYKHHIGQIVCKNGQHMPISLGVPSLEVYHTEVFSVPDLHRLISANALDLIENILNIPKIRIISIRDRPVLGEKNNEVFWHHYVYYYISFHRSHFIL